jgi:hypothetical protein
MAISRYFSESVETMTRFMYLDDLATLIIQAINGLPASILTFLSGTPFDPERAPIIARIFF